MIASGLGTKENYSVMDKKMQASPPKGALVCYSS